MHTRQGGAAHINIFYFLLILVVLLGVLGFGYVQLTDNQALQERNDTLVRANEELVVENRTLRHHSEDTGEALQVTGTYEGRPLRSADYRLERNPDDPEDDYSAIPLEGVAGIAEIRALLQEFASRHNVPEANGLPEFLDRLGNTFDALNQRVADGESQRQQLSSEKAAADASFATSSQDAAQRERDLTAQLTTLTENYEGQLAQRQATMDSLTGNVRSLRTQISDLQEQHAADLRRINDEKNRIQAQNDAMAQRYSMVNPPDAPDGRVIASNSRLGVAIVDLGRKDMLQTGVVFKIAHPDRPGEVKALGTVREVRDDQAELAISGLADPFAPVSKGDLVSNELFSPGMRRNIFLMGRFSYPFNKASVKALLERLGNTVVDEIQPGVDLVVVGNELMDEETGTLLPLDETPEYRQAQNLSIEIAPLYRVRDLLRFDER